MGLGTIYILRYITALFIFIASISLFFSVHPDNNPDFESFNHALTQDDDLKISLASSVAITIPMLIDMTFDAIYYPNLDPLLFERAMFALSLLIISLSPLAYKLGPNVEMPRIAQIYIITNFGQNMLLFFCSIAVVHRYHAKYFTGIRCVVLVIAFNIGETILCYFTNASSSPVKHYVLGVVGITNYIVYAGYLILSYFTTLEIYGRARKAKEETGYMSLESTDIISLIFLYGVMLFALAINIYTIVRGTPLLTDRYSSELIFSTYCQIVLTIVMVVIPSRMVRFEVVNVKHALETKKSIARHVYHEMRTPLNIVVIGLELLSNALATDPSSAEIDEENGEVIQDMVDAEDKDTELVEIMDNVMLSCATTVEILNDMLVFEKLEVGSYTLDLHYYNLVPFVKQTLKPFLMQAKQKNIKVKLINRLVYDAPNPSGLAGKANPLVDQHCINVDAVKMAQVVRNFVANALKFTPNEGTITVVIGGMRQDDADDSQDSGYSVGGRMKHMAGTFFGAPHSKTDASVLPITVNATTGPHVQHQDSGSLSGTTTAIEGVTPRSDVLNANRISSKKVSLGLPTLKFERDLKQPVVRISVTDTGTGISSTDVRQLFHDVVQLNADELQGGGSGFGLKIAKNIADLHGGSVGASSPGLGKGATFYVDLPLYILQNHVSSVAVDSSGMVRLLGSKSKSSHFEKKSGFDVYSDQNSNSFSLSVDERKGGGDIPFNQTLQPNDDVNAEQQPSMWTRLKKSLSAIVGVGKRNTEEYFNEQDLLRNEIELSMNSVKHGSVRSFKNDVKPIVEEDNEIDAKDGIVDNVGKCPDIDIDNVSPCSGMDTSGLSVGAVVQFSNIHRVLLVDDSAVCRRMVRKVLQNVNKQFHIDDVHDGNACLKIISRHHQKFLDDRKVNPDIKFQSLYDVVILDHAMPGISGPQTTKQLRQKDSNSYFGGLIIGLSGLADSADLDEFIHTGADTVLTKPLDIRKLLIVLREYDQNPH